MVDPFWLVFAALLVLDLTFTVVRASLTHARLPLLLNLREQRAGPVGRAVAVLERPRLRISLRLLMVAIHFCLAAALWLLVERWLGARREPGVVVAVLLLGALVVSLLETFLEGRALRSPEEWSIHLAPLGRLVDFLLAPFSALVLAVLQPQASDPAHASMVTEDELKNWVEEGQPEGSLQKGERQMIYSIFHFRDTLAREIMVPRIDILALDINTRLKDAVLAMSQSGHSRVPVYDETIDNIVGLLYAKDLLSVRQEDLPVSSCRELLRPAYFVPEAKKVDELLTELQTRRIHMAVVVDEYGGMAGLLTLEDIMEEIVGEIQDEYDQAEEMLFQQVGPDEYIFQGRIDLDDFNEITGSHLTKESADTLGGFIYGEMGRIPAGGESIETDGQVLTVELVSGRRIRKVRARRKPAGVGMGTDHDDGE